MCNVIAHHGIKGQRWGVRRTPEQLGYRTSVRGDARTQQWANNMKQALYMQTGGRGYKNWKVKENIDPRQDIVVKKGDKIQHISAQKLKDIRKGQMYVTATEEDNKNYSGFFSAWEMFQKDIDKVYKMDMEAAQDIVAPSMRKRVDTFIDLYKNDKVSTLNDIMWAENNRRASSGEVKIDRQEFMKKYGNMSVSELENRGYDLFIHSFVNPDGSISREKYFKKLKEQGYNATIDDNDVHGSFMQAKAPLIIFDAYESLKNVTISELSKKDAVASMQEWGKMKNR